jgi:diguanylate cyclase (GGDEF)-like protein
MLQPFEMLNENSLLQLFLELEKEKRASDPQVWHDLDKRFGESIYAHVLYLLTRKSFNEKDARRHWDNILEHCQAMSNALGRQVGVRLAMCDYFINMERQLEDPLLVEGDTYRKKESSVYRDELTGLYNRRFLNNVLQQQLAEAKRYDHPFSLIMFDIDRFKRYNDINGHIAGDRALAEVASILSTTARAVDYLIRYGGEEFLVILPRVGGQEAMVAAERHCRAVEQHYFAGEERLPSGKLTISAGVACYPQNAQDAMDLLHRADMALYAAKHRGRNQVAITEPERRRHPRVKYVAPVEYRPATNGNSFYQGETRDISSQGLRLAVEHPVERNKTLELVIHIDQGDDSVKLQGRAVHVYYDPFQPQPYTLGISVEESKTDASQSPLAALMPDLSDQSH